MWVASLEVGVIRSDGDFENRALAPSDGLYTSSLHPVSQTIVHLEMTLQTVDS